MKPEVRIFDPQSIAIATFLGSPIAGGLLWAINESRVGRMGRGVMVFLLAVGITGAMLALGQFGVPQGVSLGITIGATLGARAAAQGWENQLRESGQFGEITYVSRWAAAGAGMLGCVSVLGLALLAFGVDPVEGEECEGEVAMCQDGHGALWCIDGRFTHVECIGGCIESDGRVECDH